MAVVKSISVRRLFNLGNYENRTVEQVIELESDDQDKISELRTQLAIEVEREARMPEFKEVKSEIRALKAEKTLLLNQLDELKNSRATIIKGLKEIVSILQLPLEIEGLDEELAKAVVPYQSDSEDDEDDEDDEEEENNY
jgi:uncharacterized coiled-coil DUF342 family protein